MTPLQVMTAKKTSQVLIDFARPLVEALGEGYTQYQLENALKLAAYVWNLCVLDVWEETEENVSRARALVSGPENADLAGFIDMLINRKYRYFTTDLRMILNEGVTVKNGEFVVHAEASLDTRLIDAEFR